MSFFKGLRSTGKVGCGTLAAGFLGFLGTFTVGIFRDPPMPPSTYNSVSLCEAVKHIGEPIEISAKPVFVFPSSSTTEYSPLEVGLTDGSCLAKGQASSMSPSFFLDFRPSRDLSREMERQVAGLLTRGVVSDSLDSVTLRGTIREDGVLATYEVVIGGQAYSLLRE